MRVDLGAIAQSVQTEADFLRFAKALLADWEDEQQQLQANPQLQRRSSPGPNGWENGTIGGFLSAIIGWAEDVDRTRRYDTAAGWGLFAFMLLPARNMSNHLLYA